MSASTATASGSSKTKTPGKASPAITPPHASAADSVSEVNGKRMYRMSSGQMVELPADMSADEAAQLEAEGNAAQKKLGKGQKPEPVPDVKERANDKAKKKKEKGEDKDKTKAKKAEAGKKLAKGKGGEGKATPNKGFGKGKVGAWLMAKGAPVIARGKAKLEVMKSNEQKHDDASAKLGQIEKAVVPPVEEGQSNSNSGQVNAVDAKPVPQPSEANAKNTLNKSIEENIPQSIEDVDNFKRDNKAGQMSAAVALSVNTDKTAVSGTFSDLQQQPPPTPSDVKPEVLPPEEVAPETPKMNLGTGAVAPLLPEHTDVSNYTKEADSKLKDEGVTQEQLDMVDSGDLAEANKEKKGMEKKAKTEPAAVLQLAQNENKKVDTELQQEETKGKEEIKKERKNKLNATKEKQKGTKTAIEKKREEAANKINLIYKKAQDSVTKKLADLETVSMKRFDDGNAEATKQFENNVKSELDAFKDDRYSGMWGWAKKAKDWLLGMDDLPEVKAIFDRNRAAFVKTIGQLVDSISLDNKKVIQGCKEELLNARKEIKQFVDKLGPDVKEAGLKAQEEMNGKLDELDNTVNKKEEDLQNKLKDKQQAAIKAIDEKIEKMKEAMSGALSKLGKLLLLAAKKFFTWALEKFGFSLGEIEGIINKGAAVLKSIFTEPIKFVKNLMNAALLGFKNFGKNFVEHLKKALFEWLTGAMEGITLPKVWDLKGIVSFILSVIGISYANIRMHMVNEMGEKPVAFLEGTFTLVKTLITDGPIAAWEQLKEMAGEMKDALIQAVIDFVKVKVIEQAIIWLVSLFIPGAGIIKAIIGIYDTIVFFIQKAKMILQMIGNFLSSIGEIAAGNIGAAADAMENGLARGLSLAISFLAQLLHLGGITDKIKSVIKKIRDKVDGVLAKIAKWIAQKGKALLAPLMKKVDQAKAWGQKKIDQAKAYVGGKIASLTQWWKKKETVTLKNGVKHTLYFEGQEKNAVLMMRSDPNNYRAVLAGLKQQISDDKTISDKDAKLKAIEDALAIADQIDTEKGSPYPLTGAGTVEEQKAERDAAEKKREERISGWLDQLRQKTIIVFGDGKNTPSDEPVYGTSLVNEMGVSMVTKALTENHKPGTRPGETNTVYEQVKKRADGGRTYYIRGHLLNMQLGGPGEWKNMTILSQETNRKHESIYESRVKKIVNSGAIVEYGVNVDYGSRSDGANVKKGFNPADPDIAEKIKIVDAEDKLPTQLNLYASVQVRNDPQPPVMKPLFSESLKVEIDRASNNYQLMVTGNAAPKIYVNFNSKESSDYEPLKTLPIASLTGDQISKHILKLNTRGRPYGVYEVLKTEEAGNIDPATIDNLRQRRYIYLEQGEQTPEEPVTDPG